MPESQAAASAPVGIAPLLRELMAEYAATGLPPAYIPKHHNRSDHDDEEFDP
jgi:hypothetical protein